MMAVIQMIIFMLSRSACIMIRDPHGRRDKAGAPRGRRGRLIQPARLSIACDGRKCAFRPSRASERLFWVDVPYAARQRDFIDSLGLGEGTRWRVSKHRK